MRNFAFAAAVLSLFSISADAEAGCRLFGGRFSRPAQGSGACQTQQTTAASTSTAVVIVPQQTYIVRPAAVAAPANPPAVRGGDCPNGQCPNARR